MNKLNKKNKILRLFIVISAFLIIGLINKSIILLKANERIEIPVNIVESYDDMKEIDQAGIIKEYSEELSMDKEYIYNIEAMQESGMFYMELSAISPCTFEIYENTIDSNPIKAGEILSNEVKTNILIKCKKDSEYFLKVKCNIENTKFVSKIGFVIDDSFLQFNYSETEPTKNDVIVKVKPVRGYKAVYFSNTKQFKKNDKVKNNKKVIKKNGTYYVMVTDSLGNNICKPFKINNIDRKAPDKPKLTKYKKNERNIIGNAEPDTEIYIAVAGRAYCCRVNKSGQFIIRVTELETKDKIKAYIMDQAGNKSKVRNVKVK